jgi:hypothetical protein
VPGEPHTFVINGEAGNERLQNSLATAGTRHSIIGGRAGGFGGGGGGPIVDGHFDLGGESRLCKLHSSRAHRGKQTQKQQRWILTALV